MLADLMVFHGPLSAVARDIVVMNVGVAIRHRPVPVVVIDHDGVVGPANTVVAAPAPRTERCAKREPDTEIDRTADIEAGPRGRKHNRRIVSGHDNVPWSCR